MASFVTNEYKLDITPQGNYPMVYLSQFENGRQIKFIMMNRGRLFEIPSGLSASISGVKSNSGYYEHTCTFDSHNVYVPVEDDMSDASGRGVAIIKFTDGDGDTVISAKFVVNVQETPSDGGIEVPTVAETILQQILSEINTKIAELNTHIAEMDDNYQDFIDDASDRMDQHETTVGEQIQGMQNTIGNTPMSTTAQTVTGAINELHSEAISKKFKLKTFTEVSRRFESGAVANVTLYPLSIQGYRAVGMMSYKISSAGSGDNTYKYIRILGFEIDKEQIGTVDISFYNDSNDIVSFDFEYKMLYIRTDLLDIISSS